MFKYKIRNHQDIEKFVLQSEDFILNLMRGGNIDESLSEAASLNCANVSYLLAYHFKNNTKGIKDIFTFEGIGEGLTEARGHEILGIQGNYGVSAIDGTIWQFLPDDKHMRVYGPFNDEVLAVDFISKEYSGTWKMKRIPEFFLTDTGVDETVRLLELAAERRNIRRKDISLK